MYDQDVSTRAGETAPAPAGDQRAAAPGGRAPLAWDEQDVAGIGRAMAQRDVDLCAALEMFFRGAPERFNYVPRGDVPGDLRPAARLLDNICQRINSGFYLPQPGRELACRARLERWLGFQREDRREGRRGRFILDETILAPVLDPSWCRAPETMRPQRQKPGFWHALMAPIRALLPGRKPRP